MIKIRVAIKTMAVHSDGELTLRLHHARKPSLSLMWTPCWEQCRDLLGSRWDSGFWCRQPCLHDHAPPSIKIYCHFPSMTMTMPFPSMTMLLSSVKIHHCHFPSHCGTWEGMVQVAAGTWYKLYSLGALEPLASISSSLHDRVLWCHYFLGPMVWKPFGKHCYGGKAGTELTIWSICSEPDCPLARPRDGKIPGVLSLIILITLGGRDK